MHKLSYGADEISFAVTRRSRKTMAIYIRRDMSVEVVAPHSISLEKIYEGVKNKARWILKKINFYRQNYTKKTEYLYEEGEIYFYLGEQYCLKIQQSVKTDVSISDKFIILSSHYPNKNSVTKKLLSDWFMKEAEEQFKERLKVVLQHFAKPELVTPQAIVVRSMSSKWGSMSSRGIMTLNMKLIHKSIECIDYVITHELCHLVHFNHSKEYWSLVESIMPDWKERKKKLEFS